MKVETRISNRHCVVTKVTSLSIPSIKREIEERRDVCTGFACIDDASSTTNDTLFKVYDDGKTILVAVCALATFRVGEEPVPECRDGIEIGLDPYHDHVGYFHFLFEPDREPALYHHLPYTESHSTAFRHVHVKKYRWEDGGQETEWGCGDYRERWLFAWFDAADLFRRGNTCGLNVVRAWRPGKEHTSWNLAAGIGFPDATSFGHLRRRPPAVAFEHVTAEQRGSDVVIAGRLTGSRSALDLKLLDPLGNEVSLKKRSRGSSWRAEARITNRIPGRYRLYPAAGKATAEPNYVAIDLTFRRKRQPFTLGMTIDIVDDVYAAPFTPEILDAELDLCATHGINRIYWIDYLPDWLESHHDLAVLKRNARKSRLACGDLMPLGARLARKKGMDFVGVYKPYDIAYRAPSRNWLMQPHPAWHPKPTQPVARLRFHSDRPIAPLARSQVRVRQSADNKTYVPYRGRYTLRQGTVKRPHVMLTPAGPVPDKGSARNWYVELSGLRLSAPYAAVEIKARNVSLSHRAFAFVEAWDADGNRVSAYPSSGGTQHGGFLFWTEWPTWINKSPRLQETCSWQGGTYGLSFAGIENPPGLLDPGFEGAQAFWLDAVKRIVTTDAQAVDIRTLCHHNGVMDYLTVAFAQPVREAFKARYGRDATPAPKDWERIRRIRGDFFTDFMRTAARVAHAHGKQLYAHIECGMEVPPCYDQRMQIYLDWRTWLREGLLNGLTLKWWGSQSPFIHEQVLPLARRLDVPVHICEHNASLQSLRATERAIRLIRDAYRAGISGYHFYEWAGYKFRTRAGIPEIHSHAAAAIRAAARTVEELTGLRDQ